MKKIVWLVLIITLMSFNVWADSTPGEKPRIIDRSPGGGIVNGDLTVTTGLHVRNNDILALEKPTGLTATTVAGTGLTASEATIYYVVAIGTGTFVSPPSDMVACLTNTVLKNCSLTWNPVPGAVSYVIYRRTNTGRFANGTATAGVTADNVLEDTGRSGGDGKTLIYFNQVISDYQYPDMWILNFTRSAINAVKFCQITARTSETVTCASGSAMSWTTSDAYRIFRYPVTGGEGHYDTSTTNTYTDNETGTNNGYPDNDYLGGTALSTTGRICTGSGCGINDASDRIYPQLTVRNGLSLFQAAGANSLNLADYGHHSAIMAISSDWERAESAGMYSGSQYAIYGISIRESGVVTDVPQNQGGMFEMIIKDSSMDQNTVPVSGVRGMCTILNSDQNGGGAKTVSTCYGGIFGSDTLDADITVTNRGGVYVGNVSTTTGTNTNTPASYVASDSNAYAFKATPLDDGENNALCTDEGAEYYDIDEHAPCYCNGTKWYRIADGITECENDWTND